MIIDVGVCLSNFLGSHPPDHSYYILSLELLPERANFMVIPSLSGTTKSQKLGCKLCEQPKQILSPSVIYIQVFLYQNQAILRLLKVKV